MSLDVFRNISEVTRSSVPIGSHTTLRWLLLVLLLSTQAIHRRLVLRG